MAVYPAGFSERVFEFSFNAEYAVANKAILAGAPHIPTQNDEKYLGYDVAFAIQAAGGVVNVLALQHKVARKVDGTAASNAHFCTTAGSPYFAFRVDVEQFNIIESISASGLLGIEFYYCAPLFTTTADMDTHYMSNSVALNAIWIDVAAVGPLTESEPHSIVYAVGGTSAWVFSTEPKQLKVQTPRRGRGQDARRASLRRQDLRKIYDTIYPKALEYWGARKKQLPKALREDVSALPTAAPVYEATVDEETEVIAIRNLLSDYLGMSVLVEVPVPGPLGHS